MAGKRWARNTRPVLTYREIKTLPQERAYPRSKFDDLFGYPLMSTFKKWSTHGVVPTILGAAVVIVGHGDLQIRSIAVLLCGLWIVVDIGISISARNWQVQRKVILFCSATCVCFLVAMLCMRWFLITVLEDQRKSVLSGLSIVPSTPEPRKIFKTGIMVTNNGSTEIESHKISCYVRSLVMYPKGGIKTLSLETVLPKKATLGPYGDGETSDCLGFGDAIKLQGWPMCADITVTVSYAISSQPALPQEKQRRFVASDDDGFTWHQQPLDSEVRYCPDPK